MWGMFLGFVEICPLKHPKNSSHTIDLAAKPLVVQSQRLVTSRHVTSSGYVSQEERDAIEELQGAVRPPRLFGQNGDPKMMGKMEKVKPSGSKDPWPIFFDIY